MGYPIFASSITPNAGEPKGMGRSTPRSPARAGRSAPEISSSATTPASSSSRGEGYEIARRAKEVEKTESRLREEIKRGRTLSQVANLKKWEKK